MKRRKKWIGVFGGSFSPPHVGHLMAATYALKIFELDEVWLVPVYTHAFNKKLLPFPRRLKMCRSLIRGLGPRIHVSTIEKDTKSDGKMLNTLLALRRKYKNDIFSLVIGSDLLRETKKWYRFNEIEKRFMVLTVPRGKSTSSKFAIPNISSTEIRQRIRKGLPLDDLLTPDVAKLLEK